MKRLLKQILTYIMRIVSKLYSYDLDLWIQNKRNVLYTMWISNFIGEVGDKCHFKYPLRLQGGGHKRVRIGSRTSIQAYSILGAWEQYGEMRYKPEIIIGEDCNMGEFCHITAINKITIGNGLLTGRFVYIGDNAHGELSWEDAKNPPSKRELKSKGEIVIGNNVWIGDKVTILGGVIIGDNVIIGANSVVTHDIKSNSIAVGVPAEIIKKL